MKKPLLLAACLFCFSLLDAQVFKKGTFLVSGSYGLGRQLIIDRWVCGNGLPITLQKRLFNFHTRAEYAVTKHIGITGGLNITHSFYKQFRNNVIFTEASTAIVPISKVNYHFGQSKKWDPYFGIGGGIGINFENAKSDAVEELNASDSYLVLRPDCTVGIRGQVRQKLSVFAEAGYASYKTQIGISYQL